MRYAPAIHRANPFAAGSGAVDTLHGVVGKSVQARYDNSLWTDENRRNWYQADYLSAKSANSFQVRRQLRNRSRYEVSNNPYLYGVVNDNASDLIGTGPTLKGLLPSAGDNRQIEHVWQDWCAEVGFTEKLRTIKLARSVDGEGILVLKTAPTMEHPVKLYPLDIEADQMTTPDPHQLLELWVDGLVLDPITQQPIAYHILKYHPGDYFFPDLNPLKVDVIPARWVIHWFPKFRPGQVRGVPIFTPSLDLFTELRSFRKSVVTSASLAASLTAVLETQGPGNTDDPDEPIEPFSHVPVDRGMLTAMPRGYKLSAFNPAQPAATYEMFVLNCIAEACRPLSYPLNLALGTSRQFNFSSAKLDHINYHNALDVERQDCEVTAANRLLKAFLDEARLIPGLVPKYIRSIKDFPHEWHWPGYASIDPLNDAQTDHQRLAMGTLTWREYWAKRGQDWRAMMQQQDLERALIDKLGLRFGMPPTQAVTEATDSDSADPIQNQGTNVPRSPKRKSMGAEILRAFRAAFNDDQPRDENGRFAESDSGDGGDHEATHDKWQAHDDSTDEAREKEDGKTQSERDAHDDKLSEGRDREDSEREKSDAKEDKEYDRLESRHDKEESALDKQHEKEHADAQKKADAEDKEVEKARDKEDREAEKSDKQDEKEHGAKEAEIDKAEKSATKDLGARHDAEDAAADQDRAAEHAEADSRHAAERNALDRKLDESGADHEDRAEAHQELKSKHDAEHGGIDDKHDAKDQERSSRQAQEEKDLASHYEKQRADNDQALDQKQQAREQATNDRREKEDEARQEQRDQEAQAREDRHAKERDALAERHEAETKPLLDRYQDRPNRDAAIAKQRAEEDKALKEQRDQEDAVGQAKRDAEDKAKYQSRKAENSAAHESYYSKAEHAKHGGAQASKRMAYV